MQSLITISHSLDSSVLINECKSPPKSLFLPQSEAVCSKRLLALCTQKFISDLATDAYQFSKIRSSSSTSTAQAPQMGARVGRPGKDKGRSVLTLEDLSAALGDGGVNVKRPEFYR